MRLNRPRERLSKALKCGMLECVDAGESLSQRLFPQHLAHPIGKVIRGLWGQIVMREEKVMGVMVDAPFRDVPDEPSKRG